MLQSTAVLAGGNEMRKWFVPLTLLGLGGLGAVLFSQRARKAFSGAMQRAPRSPKQLREWNEAAQSELKRVQEALDRIAAQMEPGR